MQNSYTIEEIAELIGAKIKGEAKQKFFGLAALDVATSEEISFVANKKYAKYLPQTKAGAVLLDEATSKGFWGVALIVEDVYLAFAKLSHYFNFSNQPELEIDESAKIHSTAEIGENVYIGANVVIEAGVYIGEGCQIYPQVYIGTDCKIGANTKIYPQAVLYEATEVGDNCIIHSHCVLGADGFGFAYSKQGWEKIAQLGKVVVGNKVEIGAGTTIDRGALGITQINDDVKIDNLVQIGHGVSIDEHTAIAGCVGIAGSTKIGKNCLIGGGSGIAGHIQIADGVNLTGMSSVGHSILKSGTYASAIAAFPMEKWAKSMLKFRDLDDLFKRVKKLEKQLEENEEREQNQQLENKDEQIEQNN